MYSPIPIKRSSKFGNNYWEAYSPKVQRNVRLFSDLEYDYWILIETNPKIQAFCERPLEIKQIYNGKVVKAMFDMWIKWENGEEQFVEVQYSVSNRSVKLASIIQQLWCKHHQKDFLIKTEKDIRENHILLSNMKTILPYISNRPHPVETDLYNIKRYLSKVKRCTIAELDHYLALDRIRIREAIFWLLYHGQIQANVDTTPIGSSLEVWTNV
ncbi:hypothetical protein WD019_20220 [Fictibacillus sp. Mic-4]|uniref:hypothetical protein n=1 Tax=Fictibacillus sp. Mic-4 TaxID=3132826 RepID=UPI003CF12206